jgi:hypothetical protein
MARCRALGISAIPASPSERAICAIDVQINITIPPIIPASKILMPEKNERSARSCEAKIIPV